MKSTGFRGASSRRPGDATAAALLASAYRHQGEIASTEILNPPGKSPVIGSIVGAAGTWCQVPDNPADNSRRTATTTRSCDCWKDGSRLLIFDPD